MLNTLRSKQKSIMWVLVVVGVFAFVFFGVGGRAAAGAKKSTVAKINGEAVDYKEFSSIYNNMYQKQLKMYKQYMGHVNKNMRKKIQNRVKRQVINQLIHKKLLIQNAEELGLYVSVDEIKNYLQRFPAFKTDGKFDAKKWDQWLEKNPDSFISKWENIAREEILKQKMIDYLKEQITVTETEVKDYFLQKNKKVKFNYSKTNINDYLNQVKYTEKDLKNYYKVKKEKYRVSTKLDVRYLRISPRNIMSDYEISKEEAKAFYEDNKDRYERDQEVNVQYVRVKMNKYLDNVHINNNEIRNYYNNNKDQFKVGKRMKFRYGVLEAKDFFQEIDVTKKEIEEYYHNNKEEFKIKAKARARHILFRLSADQDKKIKKQKYNKAKEVLNKLKKGESFEKMAQKYSQGATKSVGGDLGYFNRGDMVKKFDEVVFDELEIGEVSDIVKTKFGYHIIKLIDKKEEHYTDFKNDNSVISSIKEKIKEKKALAILKEKQDIAEGNSFNRNIDDLNMNVKSTDYLSKNNFRKNIISDNKVVNSIYNLKKNQTSRSFINNNKLYIYKPIRVQENFYKPLYTKEVKEKIKNNLKTQKAFEKAKKAANNYYEKFKVKGVEKFESAAKQLGLKTYPTGFFQAKRSEYISGFGKDMNFKKIAFSLSYNDISEPVKVQDGYVFMRLLNKRSGFIPSYNEISNKIKQDLKYRKASKDVEKIAKKIEKSIEDNGFENEYTKKYNLKSRSKEKLTKSNLSSLLRVRRPKKIEDIKKKIFEYKKAEVTKPLKVNNMYYIFKINNKKETYIKPFEKVKKEIEKEYQLDKAKNIAIENVKKDKKITVGPVKVSDKSLDEFSKQDLNEIVDNSNKNEKIIVKDNVVYHINDINIITDEYKKMEKEKYDKIKSKLVKQKQNKYIQDWLNNKKEDSSVSIYLD